jgi:hypothetical protein
LLAPICAAAAIIVIAVGLTAVARTAGPARSVALGTHPASQPSQGGCDGTGLVDCTPTVYVRQGSGKQATVSTYLFGYSTGPGRPRWFCGIVNMANPYGPGLAGSTGGGACGPASMYGALASSFDVGVDVQTGLAAQQVTSVSAQLLDGETVRGTVVSGPGFPFKVWQVAYPPKDPATVFCYDASGRLVAKIPMTGNDTYFSLPKTGGIQVFSTASAGTMTAYLVHGLITFWTRGTWDGTFPAAGWPAVTGLLPDGIYWAGDECFGYVHAGVSRVVITLDNGYRSTTMTFTPGWPRSGVRFFAVTLPHSFFTTRPGQPSVVTQGTVTAYSKDGLVLGTEPLATTPPPA